VQLLMQFITRRKSISRGLFEQSSIPFVKILQKVLSVEQVQVLLFRAAVFLEFLGIANQQRHAGFLFASICYCAELADFWKMMEKSQKWKIENFLKYQKNDENLSQTIDS
jgi:hypothetical protein